MDIISPEIAEQICSLKGLNDLSKEIFKTLTTLDKLETDYKITPATKKKHASGNQTNTLTAQEESILNSKKILKELQRSIELLQSCKSNQIFTLKDTRYIKEYEINSENQITLIKFADYHKRLCKYTSFPMEETILYNKNYLKIAQLEEFSSFHIANIFYNAKQLLLKENKEFKFFNNFEELYNKDLSHLIQKNISYKKAYKTTHTKGFEDTLGELQNQNEKSGSNKYYRGDKKALEQLIYSLKTLQEISLDATAPSNKINPIEKNNLRYLINYFIANSTPSIHHPPAEGVTDTLNKSVLACLQNIEKELEFKQKQRH